MLAYSAETQVCHRSYIIAAKIQPTEPLDLFKYNEQYYSTTKKIVLDHIFLDIWIFMIYISSVNQCKQQMSYQEGLTYKTSCSYFGLFFSYLIFFFKFYAVWFYDDYNFNDGHFFLAFTCTSARSSTQLLSKDCMYESLSTITTELRPNFCRIRRH
jgi:hypothetical protein